MKGRNRFVATNIDGATNEVEVTKRCVIACAVCIIY